MIQKQKVTALMSVEEYFHIFLFCYFINKKGSTLLLNSAIFVYFRDHCLLVSLHNNGVSEQQLSTIIL